MDGVDLRTVNRVMQALLDQGRQPVLLEDRVSGKTLEVAPDSAAAPDGLLPVFLVAGEAVWREATGKGFKLDIQRDPSALLGYRIQNIGAGSFPVVMLSMMEATAEASGPGGILVNELGTVWRAATERLERAAGLSLAPRDGGAFPR